MATNTRDDGRRLRELRVKRKKSLKTIAELAGISEGHLSRLERGERPLDRRSLVLALADALQVSPADITRQPYAPSDETEALGHAAAPRLRAVLRDIELGVIEPKLERPLTQLRAEIDKVNRACLASDYGTLGMSVPELVSELQRHIENRKEESQGDVRVLLVQALHSAFYLAKDLGHGDLGWMVAKHLHETATQLGDPAWGALAEFVRGHAVVGDRSRERGLMLAHRGMENLSPDDADCGQVYGMLHLSAALQLASLGDASHALDHFSEAAGTSRRTGEGSFAGLMFGPTNVGVWRVALAVELGEGARVEELARQIDIRVIPSAGRQASFHGDVARGLSQQRGYETTAVSRLLEAESLAPQQVHTSPYLRATVADLLPRTRGQAGQDLNGLAYRMGIGV